MKKMHGLFFVVSLFLTGMAFANSLEKADALFDKGRYKEALQLYLSPALKDKPHAQVRIGWIYLKAPGLMDEKKAFLWFQKAAEQGSEKGQYNLATSYKDGAGTAQDYAQAMKWYKKAADQDMAAALNAIGVMHDEGRGVKADPAEAARWYARAAEKGSVAGMCNLAVMSVHAQGIKRDYAGAKALLDQCLAADPDRTCCLNAMADLYAFGRGVPRDRRKSVELSEHAARLGSARAMYNLAITYDYGLGGLKDNKAAMDWYLKAAQEDHAQALHRLYEIYQYGKLGQPVDKTKAAEWKTKAEAAMKKQGLSRNALLDKFRLTMEDQ